MVRLSSIALCLFSTAFWTIGCAPESGTPVPLTAEDIGHDHDHDHGHEHAETLGGAIAELEELRDGVSQAFADGDEEAAHGPLHEVGHLLESVSKLADASELSDEAKASIETNVESLFDLFGAVDKKMHGDDEDGKDYKDVSEGIDAAIAAIEETAEPVLGDHEGHDHEGDGHEGHDHDGEGHEGHDHDGHGDDDDGHEHAEKDAGHSKHDHDDGDKDHEHKDEEAKHSDDA